MKKYTYLQNVLENMLIFFKCWLNSVLLDEQLNYYKKYDYSFFSAILGAN